MINAYPEPLTPRLLASLAGVGLALMLLALMQVLSAVTPSERKDKPMLVLDLFDLVQLDQPKEKTPKPKRLKRQPKPKPVVKQQPEPKPRTSEPAVVQKIAPAPVIPAEPVTPVMRPEPVDKTDDADSDSLPEPVPIFRLTDVPRFLHRETPVYPEAMRATGSSGVVELAVLIDKFGNVRQVTVLKSAGELFDQAAIAAVRASTFIAARVDDQPVAAILKMPVKFRLL